MQFSGPAARGNLLVLPEVFYEGPASVFMAPPHIFGLPLVRPRRDAPLA